MSTKKGSVIVCGADVNSVSKALIALSIMNREENPDLTVVYHNGCAYDFTESILKKEPILEFVDYESRKPEDGRSKSSADELWVYEVSGLHNGPNIKLYVRNPRYEDDDEDYVIVCDDLYWYDTNTVVHEIVSDAYWSSLRSDISDSYQSTNGW